MARDISAVPLTGAGINLVRVVVVEISRRFYGTSHKKENL
jgi:hypothetical protein